MVVKLERPRYLLVRTFGNLPEIGQFITALRKSIISLMGDIFLAQSSLHIVNYSSSSIIIRSTNLSRDPVEAALQMIKLPNLVLRVVLVSGTIKKIGRYCSKNLMKMNPLKLRKIETTSQLNNNL